MSLLDELHDRRELLLALAARRGAHDIRVFGSVAQRQESATSDVDLLVRLDRDRNLFDLCSLGDELEDALGRRVDVVTEAALSA